MSEMGKADLIITKFRRFHVCKRDIRNEGGDWDTYRYRAEIVVAEDGKKAVTFLNMNSYRRIV